MSQWPTTKFLAPVPRVELSPIVVSTDMDLRNIRRNAWTSGQSPKNSPWPSFLPEPERIGHK